MALRANTGPTKFKNRSGAAAYIFKLVTQKSGMLKIWYAKNPVMLKIGYAKNPVCQKYLWAQMSKYSWAKASAPGHMGMTWGQGLALGPCA